MSPQRKPSKSEGSRKHPCYCGCDLAEHANPLIPPRGRPTAGQCDNCSSCRHFIGRPNNGARTDLSPGHLLRMGIKAGEWGSITLPQLRAMMRPDSETTTRVYACGLWHSVGQTNKRLVDGKGNARSYSDAFALKHPERVKNWMTPNRGRLAVKFVCGRDGKWQPVPLQPIDIVRELNELDIHKTLTKGTVRRALRELETQGKCRAGGRPVHGERLLLFYARPLAGRTGISRPELVEEPCKSDREEPCNPSPHGCKSDPIAPVSSSERQTCAIVSFRKVFVKSSLDLCRRTVGDGVNLDPMRPEIDRIFEGVKNTLIQLADGIKNGAAYKEDSSISTSSDLKEREACLPAPPDKAAGRPSSLLNEKRKEVKTFLIKKLGNKVWGVPGNKVVDDTIANLGDASLEDLGMIIDERYADIEGYGLVPELARDAAERASTKADRAPLSAAEKFAEEYCAKRKAAGF